MGLDSLGLLVRDEGGRGRDVRRLRRRKRRVRRRWEGRGRSVLFASSLRKKGWVEEEVACGVAPGGSQM
jgi:hypothetical protein